MLWLSLLVVTIVIVNDRVYVAGLVIVFVNVVAFVSVPDLVMYIQIGNATVVLGALLLIWLLVVICVLVLLV